MNIMNNKFIYILLYLILCNVCLASNTGRETGLEIPRFVSIKSDDINIRIGPSKNYPILIKYIIKNFPLKIIDEHKEWRKVIDFEGNSGWIHKSLIKGERNAIIVTDNENNLLLYNTVLGKKIGEVKKSSLVELKKCKINWCLISKDNNYGWIEKKYLWGVKKNEIFNIGFFQKLFDYYFTTINIASGYLD